MRAIKPFAIASVLLLPAMGLAGDVPLTPGSPADLDDMQKEIARFEEANKDYRGTVSHIVQREYIEKRQQLMSRYQGQIDKEEGEQKTRRMSAIAMFEAFLAKYGHDDRWTPDAMFRLAELYFEKDNDSYLTASAQANQSGAQVLPDYSKTVDIFKDLISRFPNYRLVDGAYYLMGWCLAEMNKDAESLQAMRSLVCSNKYKPLDPPPPAQPTKGKGQKVKIEDPYTDCTPVKKDSRFLPEAWTRVGEAHFDNSELELAIAAYTRVLQFTDSPYFDKALYKLAWAYYRADDYPDAIKRFDELVVYSDKKKAESGNEGSDLRAEAVQYLGISFAEKDWNGDGVEDAKSGIERAEEFYKGRENEPHVREIFARLGDIYFDETEYFKAIQVYKRTLDKWPLDPANPKLQDRVVAAFERQRDADNALKERERMFAMFGKGTPWRKHNQDNKEALDTADQLNETAMVMAAVNHHKAAQDLKKLAAAKARPDGKMLEQISKEYALAAVAYEKYLDTYKDSKNTYEYTYDYAECLYYSGRFLEAATQYEKVRDSNLDNRFAEDAAFNAIKSYEKYLDLQKQAGRYVEPPVPTQATTKPPIKPIQMPEAVSKLQAAYSDFAKRAPTSAKVPTMVYKVAETDFRYLNWDKARPEFEAIVGKYCKDDMGANAGQAIILSYTIENDINKLDEWSKRLQEANCGSATVAAQNKAALQKMSLGIAFKKADDLFAQKKFEEAAALYTDLVNRDPKNPDADKALNNAAVAYENVNRFAAATKMYERVVQEYPDSKFVDDALFRTAVSYQKNFDFDKAVVSYERLAEDKRFAGSAHRLDSIYNAAVILENDQNYAKAATLFQKYAADPGVKREDQSEAFFRSAGIIEKMKQPKQALAAYQQYVKKYGQDPKGSSRNVEAYFHMALAYEAMHDRHNADETYKKVVILGMSVPPASDNAEFPAHAAFILAEERLPIVTNSKLSGDPKTLKKSMDNYMKNVQSMVAEYDKVLTYRRATWQLAAYYRIGYLFESYSKAMAGLLQLPCPAEVKRKFKQEGCDVYMEQLQKQIEAQLTPVDEEVVKRYSVTLEQAGKLGVSNEWTRLARQSAHNYNPDKFPLVKDEHIDSQLENP